jgi:enoyl-CoA hydratase/carnithine racemase
MDGSVGVLAERAERVLILTIDHPPVNALTTGIRRELARQLDAADEKEVGCIIVIGAGHRAFCAGQDLGSQETMDGSPISADVLQSLDTLCDQIRSAPQPVIAALNGVALGGGLELALSCDLRVAAAEVRLGAVGLKMGLVASTQRLTRIAGESVAKWMTLTGEYLNAQQGLAAGLVHEIVEPQDLRPRALDLARRIADYPPHAVALTKRVVNLAMDVPLETGLRIQRAYAVELLDSTEHRRAVQTFRKEK